MRLIDADALIERMNDTNIHIMLNLPVEEVLGEDVDMDDFCTLLQDAIQTYRKLVLGEVINKAPTIEAFPVVRGKWVHLGGDEWCCSECGHVIHTEGSWEKPEANFCEECGADMRKKVDE